MNLNCDLLMCRRTQNINSRDILTNPVGKSGVLSNLKFIMCSLYANMHVNAEIHILFLLPEDRCR